MMDELKRVALKLFELIKRAWADFKALFNQAEDTRKKIDQEKKMRSSWITVRDSRKPSQVVNKRPLFAIQKII